MGIVDSPGAWPPPGGSSRWGRPCTRGVEAALGPLLRLRVLLCLLCCACRPSLRVTPDLCGPGLLVGPALCVCDPQPLWLRPSLSVCCAPQDLDGARGPAADCGEPERQLRGHRGEGPGGRGGRNRKEESVHLRAWVKETGRGGGARPPPPPPWTMKERKQTAGSSPGRPTRTV